MAVIYAAPLHHVFSVALLRRCCEQLTASTNRLNDTAIHLGQTLDRLLESRARLDGRQRWDREGARLSGVAKK